MHALVICGISASGKSTLAEQLENFGFGKVVTSTTRQRREGEVNGVDYHFMHRGEFESLIDAGSFVDYAEIHGNLYGSKIRDYEKIHAEGRIPVLVCDPTGAKNLEKYAKNNNFFSFTSVFLNLNSPDAANRFLQRMDNDLSSAEAGSYNNVIKRHAKRMSKVFDPDISICEDLCHQYLSGRKGTEAKLSRLYQNQQTIVLRGDVSECSEHSWASDYNYDLVIKEGIDAGRQHGVIKRIQKALELGQHQKIEPASFTIR